MVRAVQTFATRPSGLYLNNSSDSLTRMLLKSGCKSVKSERRDFQTYSQMRRAARRIDSFSFVLKLRGRLSIMYRMLSSALD
jgi:hypothetical protein